MKRCEWCNHSLKGRRSDARYCDAECRLDASKARRGLSVQKPYKRTSGPSGLQVSYRKAVRTLALEVAMWGVPTEPFADAVEYAQAVLRPCLSPAQRARLEARS